VKKPSRHTAIIPKVSAKFLLTIWVLLGLIPAFCFFHGKYSHRNEVHRLLSQNNNSAHQIKITLPSSTTVLGEQFERKDFYWNGDCYDVISVNRTSQKVEIIAVIDDFEKGIDMAFQSSNSQAGHSGILVERKFDGLHLIVIYLDQGLTEFVAQGVRGLTAQSSMATTSGYLGIETPPPELRG